jgi:hypothetical protein
MGELSGRQMVAKFAAIVGILFVSAVPFTTDVNLIVAPSPYTSPYLVLWAAVSAFAYYRWRHRVMVKEIAGPLAIMFALLAVGALFA